MWLFPVLLAWQAEYSRTGHETDCPIMMKGSHLVEVVGAVVVPGLYFDFALPKLHSSKSQLVHSPPLADVNA